ncbi:hypothetical protein [Paraburkholderia phenoliruptrix]|uniref:Uncharacterized protein n=1 Tax=Paraburkholderia phenoliruptrix TaxID=252970 RepID=A0ABV3WKP4_9BURK
MKHPELTLQAVKEIQAVQRRSWSAANRIEQLKAFLEIRKTVEAVATVAGFNVVSRLLVALVV